MNIKLAKKFAKQYSKAPRKIQNAFNSRLKIFKEKPFHSLLNNHLLKGNYYLCRSINITGDWRGIFFETLEKEGKVVIFITLGTHNQLYK